MLSSDKLKRIRDYFASQPIDKVFLVGSYARNEEVPTSDVDILIEIDDSIRLGLVRFSKMKFELEDLLEQKVDLLARGGVSKYILPKLEKDKVLVYEKGNR
jgi:uncharacterized protein